MSFSRSRLPVWLHTVLVAALLWAPLWGQLHNIGHGSEHVSERWTRHALSASGELQTAHAHAGQVHDEHQHEGPSDALGHEADADLCRLLDHLSQAERLSAPCSPGIAPMVATKPPIFRVAFSADPDLWSPAQARAPPALI
ncbi:MAG: hypothetical protein KAY21_07120 [Limnohabitans sp.]|nr:hypothetical protein [Limnohabitans sp.]